MQRYDRILNMKSDGMEYKSLTHESLREIYQCFNEAFSDYFVKIQLPLEKFQRMMVRNGVDLRFSIGLYDGDTLVGFILNGTGIWNNFPTVYDSGTGIIREYRGKKYSKKMFTFLKRTLLENNFSQYILEVIQTNIPAYTLYSSEGFKIERELLCFKGIGKDVIHKPGLPLQFRKMSSLNWNVLQPFWDSTPSWQNSIHAVERISSQLEKIGVFIDNTCIGYGIFDPQSGEIIHIAVKKDMRRKGIGSALLHEISVESKGDCLRIVNVDKRDQETVAFFKGKKFINDVSQYEMTLNLKQS
jgi:ribosomal protein S18 acetylase RimI-like enzyme